MVSLFFNDCNDKVVDSGTDINLGPVITFDDNIACFKPGDSLSLSVTAEDSDGVSGLSVLSSNRAQFGKMSSCLRAATIL